MRSVSKLFGVQYNTVKDWVIQRNRSLQNQFVETSKIDLSKLSKQVLEYLDRFQYEHAQTFGVTQSAISKALNKLGITLKI